VSIVNLPKLIRYKRKINRTLNGECREYIELDTAQGRDIEDR